MGRLSLRNVPDDVADHLTRLGRREGLSVNAVAVRLLAEASRRADNEVLLAALPDLAVEVAAIVDDVRMGRSDP